MVKSTDEMGGVPYPPPVSNDPAQFYTGLVADAYAALRGTVSPVDPYLRFVKRFGTPALEIGCGHGEPLLDLVAQGLEVVGLDSSADMLANCGAEALRRGLTVDLVCQPMETMQLNREFAAIYFAGPTFQLVIDLDAAADALTRIASHLAPSGRALIPLFVPDPIDERMIGRWKEHVTEVGDTLAVRTLSQSSRPDERRIDTVLESRRGTVDSPTEVVTRTWSLRWYGEGEFETLSTGAGLAVDAVRDHGAFGRSLILRRVDASI